VEDAERIPTTVHIYPKDFSMSIKITNQPFSWPRSDIDPSWIPLCRAPFVYRLCSGEDWCEGWENGTPEQQLASWLRQAGVREAIIDRSSGEFSLTLPEGASGPFNLPVCCHPAEFDPADIRNEHLRSTVSAQVLFVWTRMQDEFRRAVAERRCVIVARAGSMLNGFILIAPDVFRHFEVTDWQKGEAVNAAGEKLFSIHVAPPQSEAIAQSGYECGPSLGLVTEQVCNYLQRVYPNGKPLRLSYQALTKELEGVGVHASEATVRHAAQTHLGWPRRGKKA
jgi:hypothetical protein